MEIVDNCPHTEDKWMEAAARKNCETYASQCDEPDRFVYHCVINAFINQTLEVCAYRRVIVLGFCTEYSFGGNVIQQNFKANCSKFTHNPCPSSYPSTDAYKYPGCYEMTKKTTARPPTITTPSTVNATYMNNEKQANEGSSTCIVLAIALVVLGFAVLIACLCIWRKKKMFFMKRGIVSFIAQNCVYIIKLNVSLFLIGKVSDQLYNKIFSFVSHAKGQF